jgi:hypothetical protein
LRFWTRAARRIVWRRAVFIVPAGCGPDVTFRRKKIPAWPLFWIAADPLAADREEWTSGSGAKARIARFDVKDVTLCKGSNRRGGRVAEGARLESVFTGNRNVGSNPTPSASVLRKTLV